MEEKDESFEETLTRVRAEIAFMNEPLFTPGVTPDSWATNAVLHKGWEVYIDGYKRAADILVQYVTESNWEQDILVYPIVFLYRQYLELRLKDLIYVGSALVGQKADWPTTHDLLQLWNRVRPMLEQAFPRDNPRDLDLLESKIKEFCRFDPKSESFRYPLGRNGKPTLLGLDIIDLAHLKDVVLGMSNVLDGASTGMWEYLQAKSEAEREE